MGSNLKLAEGLYGPTLGEPEARHAKRHAALSAARFASDDCDSFGLLDRGRSASLRTKSLGRRRHIANYCAQGHGLASRTGLVRRVHGAGSFITPRTADPLSRLVGFTRKMEQRGFKPDSIWLNRSLRAASREKIVRLGLSSGASVASLQRLRHADGIVMAMEHSTLPAVVVPDPSAIDALLYRYLEARGQSNRWCARCSIFAQ